MPFLQEFIPVTTAPSTTAGNTIQASLATVTPLSLKQEPGTTVTGPITWGTNSGANVSVSGSTVTRVGASAWDGGALGNTQITSLVDGYIEWTENDITKLHVGGLSNTSGTWSYSSVNFGIYNNNGTAQIYEFGTNVAAFATIANGDVLRVSCIGGVVKYYQNGVLKYTSLNTPTFPLYGMVSEYTQTGTFNPTYSTSQSTQTVDLLDILDSMGAVMSSIDRIGQFVASSGIVVKRTATAGSYSVVKSDFYVGVTSTAAAYTITLPPIANVTTGKLITIKNESGTITNNITVKGNASELIDGANTQLITTTYGALRLISNGTSWSLI